MTNLEKFNGAFLSSMNIKASDLNDNLAYLRNKAWDSLAHYDMISALEEAFDISFSSSDVVRFNTYAMGKKLMKDNYGITIE
ncbi:MAG: acyl carrier protein [Intestinimonas sp.]|nr:acyl carrier protein [Intestinimonas sp.]